MQLGLTRVIIVLLLNFLGWNED